MSLAEDHPCLTGRTGGTPSGARRLLLTTAAATLILALCGIGQLI